MKAIFNHNNRSISGSNLRVVKQKFSCKDRRWRGKGLKIDDGGVKALSLHGKDSEFSSDFDVVFT